MMSALGGEGGSPKAIDSNDRLFECDSDKWDGIPNPENFADVIYGWSLESCRRWEEAGYPFGRFSGQRSCRS